MKKLIKIFIILIFLIMLLVSFYYFCRSMWHPIYVKYKGKRTVSDVVKKYRNNAKGRLIPYFDNAYTIYPPKKIALIGIKDIKSLELWAKNKNNWVFIRNYRIKGASGKLGPKLREGDKQVPEGVYKIIALNPNSSYHLSMKLNCPNKFDMKYAKKEGRTEPGSNIFIHGSSFSIGCLAMGDKTIEELFLLVQDVGLDNIKVIIAPYDFRQMPIDYTHAPEIKWLPKHYNTINTELAQMKIK